MQKELVSIIVPIYNMEKYLDKCMESILNQTYREIEVILVNDGSKDKSLEICNKYSMQDKRVIIIDKENEGVSAARNDGIKKANGTYITFVDADDYVDNDFIETLISRNNNYDIIFSHGKDFNDNREIKVKNIVEKDFICDNVQILKELMMQKKVRNVCWGKLYKTSIIKNILFDTNLKIAEDFKFLLEAVDKSKSFLVTNVYKYHYYIRSDSAIHDKFSDKWYGEFELCRQLIKKYEGTEFEDYAIKRFMRVNIDTAYAFDLEKADLKRIRDNIKQYIRKFLRYDSNVGVSKEKKIKCIIICYFYPFKNIVRYFHKKIKK